MGCNAKIRCELACKVWNNFDVESHEGMEKWKPQKWILDGAQLIISDIWIVVLCYEMARISYFVEPMHTLAGMMSMAMLFSLFLQLLDNTYMTYAKWYTYTFVLNMIVCMWILNHFSLCKLHS